MRTLYYPEQMRTNNQTEPSCLCSNNTKLLQESNCELEISILREYHAFLLNLEAHQYNISQLMIVFILITCLLDSVLYCKEKLDNDHSWTSNDQAITSSCLVEALALILF